MAETGTQTTTTTVIGPIVKTKQKRIWQAACPYGPLERG